MKKQDFTTTFSVSTLMAAAKPLAKEKKGRLRRDGQLALRIVRYERGRNLRRAIPARPTMPVPSITKVEGSGVCALPNERS